MKEKQFQKEIAKIQKFLNLNDWDISYRIMENPWFAWELTTVDYKRFQAYFSFSKALLDDKDEFIRKVIMHEFTHIFTIMNLRQFSEDDYLKNNIWWNNHAEVVVRMDILNEQMTVLLEKILTKQYVKSIPNN